MRKIKLIMVIIGICSMLVACDNKANTDSDVNTHSLETSSLKPNINISEEKNFEEFSLDFSDIPENNYCLTVSEGGEVIFVSDKGELSGSDAYIKKIEKLYTGVPKPIILNNNITVLGEDGKLYSEFEINENISTWTSMAGLGNVLLKLNESKAYECINSNTFPKLQLMVLTEDGKIMGGTFESLQKKGAVIYSLEEEKITDLSGKYALAETGNVYEVNVAEGCLDKIEGVENVVAIDSFEENLVMLSADGKVRCYGKGNFWDKILGYNMEEMAEKLYLSTSYMADEQTDMIPFIQDWNDIVSVKLGNGFCVGLKKDGTVVIKGKMTADKALGVDTFEEVGKWTKIKAISTDGCKYIAGLTVNDEVMLNYKRGIPEFLAEISDEIYFEGFELWDGANIGSIDTYSAFDGVCELVIDGVRHKAIYSDSGVVLIENEENCTLVYNGKQLIIPESIKLEYSAFRLDIFFFDLDGDEKKELIFDYYWDEWDNYFYPVDLEKMEFIPIEYTALLVEELFNYGIEKTEVLEDGSVKAYFYIENNLGERINGDVRLENTEADWKIEIVPVVGRIYRRNATTLLGNTQLCVYSPDNKEFEDMWKARLFGEGEYDIEYDVTRTNEYQKTIENINFKAVIEYDDEYEKYIPADYKLTFSWIDSQGQEQEENLRAVKNR